MHTLAINIDEIASNVEGAIPFLRKNKINTVELRTIEGRNIANFNEEKIHLVKKDIEENNLSVCAIASPLFKWYRGKPSKPEFYNSYDFPCVISEENKLLAINNVMKNSELLGVNKIRVFSGLRIGEPNIGEVMSDPLLQLMVDQGNEKNIKILIENEPICHIHKLNDIKKTLQQIAGLGLWLDIANFYQIKEGITLHEINDLLPYVHHVHLKDFVFDKDNKIQHVPLGEGCIPWKDILPMMHNNASHSLSMSIETHIDKDKLSAVEKSIKFYQKTLQL